jgi:hypothetical protein
LEHRLGKLRHDRPRKLNKRLMAMAAWGQNKQLDKLHKPNKRLMAMAAWGRNTVGQVHD